MIVFLWDAPGSTRTGRGVSGEAAAALRAAEACMRAGHARAARVEAAVAILGTETLTSGYQRTGTGWQARRDRSGVRWEPFAENPD